MNRFKIILLLSFIFCIFSCSEFIEYPLEKEEVKLLAPSDSYETTDSIQTFWWSTHEDAKYYRLQIAKPNFINTNKIILDSVTTSDKLILKLDTGIYSWRVRPENDGSAGYYVERALKVIGKP
jgi:hypothetical protein